MTAALSDALFRSFPDPVWIFRPDSGRIVAVNPAALQVTRYTEDAFVGRLAQTLWSDPPHPRLILSDGSVVDAVRRESTIDYLGEPACMCVATLDPTSVASKIDDAAALAGMAGRLARFGGWRVDVASSAVTWSDEAAAIHDEPAGSSTSVAEGLNYYTLDSRPLIEEAFARCVATGEPFDLTLQIKTRGGRRLWVRTAGEAVRRPTGEIVEVRGAFQDVDEIVRARESLRVSEARLAVVLDRIDDGLMVLSSDYRIVYLNKAGQELLSVGGDLIGRDIWDAFPESANSVFRSKYEEAVRSGSPVHYEAFYAPGSVCFEVRAYPFAEGLVSHFRNITERVQAQAELLSSEERFRLVAKVTNDVIWDWDLQTDAVWFNDHLKSIYGLDPADCRTSESWAAQVVPEDRDRVAAALDAAIAGSAQEWRDEYGFMGQDGKRSRVVDRALIIRDAGGQARRLIGSMMDITERTAVERQLREAQKLEAVGQLTGGVAHDFNNLLTVIIGTAESLTERVSDDAESLMLAEMTAAAADRGAQPTNRLLAFARRQPLEPRTVDVGRLVLGLDPMMRRTLSEQIDLEVVRGGGLWTALVDPGQLETAILNLAINARDAMPMGGRLTIETTNASLDQDYAQQNAEVAPGQYVTISVSDTGYGMDASTLSRAFEPFFTTKEIGQGSGLGLSMVYGFAKQSRGHVKIYSEVGEGTTVRLYLPRSQEGLTASANLPREDVPKGDERILVVEDDDLVRGHVARQLTSLGYTVFLANHAAAALESIDKDGPFDLLFTDVVMPGLMNGRHLAETARKMQPNLKVLYTSGYTENAIVHHGRLDPGVALLSKPYRRADLAKRIRQVLDGAELTEER